MEKAVKIEWPQAFALRITLWIETRRSPRRLEASTPRKNEKVNERNSRETYEAYRLLQLPK